MQIILIAHRWQLDHELVVPKDDVTDDDGGHDDWARIIGCPWVTWPVSIALAFHETLLFWCQTREGSRVPLGDSVPPRKDLWLVQLDVENKLDSGFHRRSDWLSSFDDDVQVSWWLREIDMLSSETGLGLARVHCRRWPGRDHPGRGFHRLNRPSTFPREHLKNMKKILKKPRRGF